MPIDDRGFCFFCCLLSLHHCTLLDNYLIIIIIIIIIYNIHSFEHKIIQDPIL